MAHLRHTQYQIITKPILSDIPPDENIIPWFQALTEPIFWVWWRDWFRVGFTLAGNLPDPVTVTFSATETNSDILSASVLVAFSPVNPDLTMSVTEVNNDIFTSAIFVSGTAFRARVSLQEVQTGRNPASLWEE